MIKYYVASRLGQTDQGIVDELNAPSEQIVDTELKTNRSIIVAFGPDAARAMISAFKAAADADPLLASVYLVLCSSGIDFSAPVAQGMIDQLVGSNVFTSEQGDQLKSLGVRQQTLANKFIGRPATIEDVVAARSAIDSENTERIVRDAATRRINQLWANIGSCRNEADVVAEFSK